MKLYDREEQLEMLREMRELSYNGYSRLTVVTGRRRIGKTTLIKEAYKDEPYVYLFVGRKSESVLCREFCEEYQAKTGTFVPPMSAFRDVFRFLMEEGKRRKYTLVFDEFQNFLEVNPSIYSDIQNWWDPKGYIDKEGNHQQAELDIVALRLNENVLDVIEVKRNPEKFSKSLLEEKVDFFSSKEKLVRKNRIVLSCLSLNDM